MTAWVPQACTLPTAEQPLRVAEFDDLLAAAIGAPTRRGPERLEIVLAPGTLAAVRDLVARESACCTFFAFGVRETAEGVLLDVGVPAAQVGILDAMQRAVEAALSRPGGQPVAGRVGDTDVRSSS